MEPSEHTGLDDLVEKFYDLIEEDPMIGPGHICLFISLCHISSRNKSVGEVSFRRAELMKLSKISGIATYHKYIKELAEGGYIKYKPSYNPKVLNGVKLVK